MSEAEALLAGLIGRWPSSARSAAGAPARRDPLGAVASLAQAAALGTGTLDGLRLAAKDNIAVAEAPTALGSGQPGFVPRQDATVVQRARRAGATVVAKAQCEAFLLGANSFSTRPAPVRNPYDPARSAGGSSSGSAAMVAAGLVDLAFGTDSGGSIRIPAAFCGVVGFKPTRGRVPYTGIAPLEPFLEHVGPIARSVAQASALFDAVDGPDGVDPRCGWARRSVGEGSAGSVRLGVFEAGFELAEAPVGRALDVALGQLEERGFRRSPLRWPGFEEAQEVHLAIYIAGQALTARASAGPSGISASAPDGWAAWRAGLDEQAVPDALAEALAAGDALNAADPGLYARAIARALVLADELDTLLDEVDLLVLPTAPGVAPPIPHEPPTTDAIYGDTRLTAPFNATGHPALSLPAGFAHGLPVGLQLVGRRGRDQALLKSATAMERAFGPLPPPIGDFGELE